MEFVLPIERNDGTGCLYQRHHGIDGEPGHEPAGPEREIDHVAIAGGACGGLVEIPFRALELGANLRYLGEFPVHLRAEPLLYLLARSDRLLFTRSRLRFGTARGIQLSRELGQRGLRLLEIELGAGAGSDQLTVLRDALAGEIELGRHLGRPRRRLLDSALGLGDLSLCALQRLLKLLLLRNRVGELCRQRVDLKLIRSRVDPEKDIPLLDRHVAFLDRNLDHTATDLRNDWHSEPEYAHVGRRRCHHVEREDHYRERDDGNEDDGDLRIDVPRQPLELDEDQPDEERVDAEEEDVHYAAPPAAGGTAAFGWIASRSARSCLRFGGRAPLAAIASSSVRRCASSSSSSWPAFAFSPISSCHSSALSVP